MIGLSEIVVNGRAIACERAVLRATGDVRHSWSVDIWDGPAWGLPDHPFSWKGLNDVRLTAADDRCFRGNAHIYPGHAPNSYRLVGEGALERADQSAEPRAKNAWLLVNGKHSIRMEVRPLTHGFELTIAGPGKERRTLRADDLATLLQQQADLQAIFVAAGYSVDELRDDRRRFFRSR